VTRLLALVLALLLPLGGLILPPGAHAAMDPVPERFVCAGDPLLAEVYNGAVDAADIPNRNDGTLPGSFIVLQWRDVTLQLPRTNNAGSPSYSDGRWWWQALDPDHPDFAQRRGDWESYACEASA